MFVMKTDVALNRVVDKLLVAVEVEGKGGGGDDDCLRGDAGGADDDDDDTLDDDCICCDWYNGEVDDFEVDDGSCVVVGDGAPVNKCDFGVGRRLSDRALRICLSNRCFDS